MSDTGLAARVTQLEGRLEAVKNALQTFEIWLQSYEERSAAHKLEVSSERHKASPVSHRPGFPYPSPSHLAVLRRSTLCSYQEAAVIVIAQRSYRRRKTGGLANVKDEVKADANIFNLPRVAPCPALGILNPRPQKSRRPVSRLLSNSFSPFKKASQPSSVCKNDNEPHTAKLHIEPLHRQPRPPKNAINPRFVTSTGLCTRYSSTGSCRYGIKCFGAHDPNKLALCPSVSRGVSCFAGPRCSLSHVPSPERSPLCLFFQLGRCSRDNCVYAHTVVNPTAPLCTDFAYAGYCDKGTQCGYRHLRQCPEFTNTGECQDNYCRLPHVVRSTRTKMRDSNGSGTSAGSGTLVGSPDDEKWDDELDSGSPVTVDRAPAEEYMSGPGDFASQDDFIRL
ncbi:hypothetical protein A1O1_08173 [Capronia coronata CBS 617.96]|uniref:C3H1-type domain-containing protein n=1 Tax=Capronia coronata CBS 617.96 TaxID=1182541 RepID=W9YIH6_9EURO|nr:uncharacterized protein A1O1_08173 [Capronia coronata CBS 617.96]EXJ82104.1 hypothetical protein A1O1_08173 [Capronia coronata CBS 617.96]